MYWDGAIRENCTSACGFLGYLYHHGERKYKAMFVPGHSSSAEHASKSDVTDLEFLENYICFRTEINIPTFTLYPRSKAFLRQRQQNELGHSRSYIQS